MHNAPRELREPARQFPCADLALLDILEGGSHAADEVLYVDQIPTTEGVQWVLDDLLAGNDAAPALALALQLNPYSDEEPILEISWHRGAVGDNANLLIPRRDMTNQDRTQG
jgi:hypothetical protein